MTLKRTEEEENLSTVLEVIIQYFVGDQTVLNPTLAKRSQWASNEEEVVRGRSPQSFRDAPTAEAGASSVGGFGNRPERGGQHSRNGHFD